MKLHIHIQYPYTFTFTLELETGNYLARDLCTPVPCIPHEPSVHTTYYFLSSTVDTFVLFLSLSADFVPTIRHSSCKR